VDAPTAGVLGRAPTTPGLANWVGLSGRLNMWACGGRIGVEGTVPSAETAEVSRPKQDAGGASSAPMISGELGVRGDQLGFG